MMDQDRSKTLDAHECQSYLAEIGYLDEEIDNFFAVCDRDGDGSISWDEFILGAAVLYKPKAKASSAQQHGAVAAVLQVTPQGSSSQMQVSIDSGMSWSDVTAATKRVMQEGPDGPAHDSETKPQVLGPLPAAGDLVSTPSHSEWLTSLEI